MLFWKILKKLLFKNFSKFSVVVKQRIKVYTKIIFDRTQKIVLTDIEISLTLWK